MLNFFSLFPSPFPLYLRKGRTTRLFLALRISCTSQTESDAPHGGRLASRATGYATHNTRPASERKVRSIDEADETPI